MNRYIGVLVASLIAGSAFAGSPPPWAHGKAKDNQRTQAQQADSRDVNQASRASDGKRSAPVQIKSPPQVAANSNQPPAPMQRRPPITRQPPQVVRNDNDRDRAGNGDRGDRRGFDDPRPATNWQGEHDRGRNGDSNRSDDRDQNRANQNWNRGHDNRSNRDRNWSDRNGRDWRRDRGWYDQYRYRHYRFYNQRFFARNRFFAGNYYAPYGYGSRIWFAGDFLPIVFFQDRYFLDHFDSFDRFQLYDPPYGCQWVRVGTDALLVDRNDGFVLDVIYNLFW